MQNNNRLNIEIESSSLLGRMKGNGIYTYNLIKYLALIEKNDRFLLSFPGQPFFRNNNLDFKQHNLIPKWEALSFFSEKASDVYHDASCDNMLPKQNSKNVITVHDISYILNPEWTSAVIVKTFENALKQALRSFDAVIVPSNNTKSDLISCFNTPANKITVISEGVADSFAPASSSQVGLIKTRYSLPRKYILYIGAIEERKNIKRLLEAYALLKYESPPVLVIAGQYGWMKETIQAIAKRLDILKDIKILGYVPKKDLPALYSGAEFFIWPTLYEGFGLPVLEAMASGCPVISSFTSSIPEVCADAAILTDPYNREKIAGAMRSLLSDAALRVSLKEKGLIRAKEFSLKKMAQETLTLYRKLACK